MTNKVPDQTTAVTLAVPGAHVLDALRRFGYSIDSKAKIMSVHATEDGDVLLVEWSRHETPQLVQEGKS